MDADTLSHTTLIALIIGIAAPILCASGLSGTPRRRAVCIGFIFAATSGAFLFLSWLATQTPLPNDALLNAMFGEELILLSSGIGLAIALVRIDRPSARERMEKEYAELNVSNDGITSSRDADANELR